MKIALVYDHVNRIGGAERILTALHELYPAAPLYTSVYDAKHASWARDFEIHTSWLQKFPFLRKHHEWYPGLPYLVFEQFDFSTFDVVISITSAEAKAVITGSRTLHICYCLTPTRYLWSHYEEYFKNPWFKILSLPYVSFLRIWDTIVARRPDRYLAISETVKERIARYYGQNARVVYPPVDTDLFRPINKQKPGNYFLVVSRLVQYKHIELAIQVCNELQLPLKIIGEGPQKKYLQSCAGPTVEFLGHLTEAALVGYYQDCRALLFTAVEDFGISPLEAAACGRPVIALNAAGTLETVVAGKTGEFFWSQTPEALRQAVERFMHRTYDPKKCREQALKFSKKSFQQKFGRFIKEEWEDFNQ